jgi:micrococcal nuclease
MMRTRGKLPSNPVVLVLLLIASVAGVLSQRPTGARKISLPDSRVEAPLQTGKARVIKITDGDTLHAIVRTEGSSEPSEQKIRLFGINTPELHARPGTPKDTFKPELFSQEAADFLQKVCPLGTDVSLELHDRDKYDRLLAVIILPDGRSVNKLLIEAGLAKAYFPYSSKHHPMRPEYESAQQRAVAEKRGIWSVAR